MADNKNVVDKTNLTTHTGVEVDSTKVASQNWISQITAGDNVTYDIATHHAITFRDGNDDNVGVKWNGLTDLEIVIPTIKDIVQTPIEFAGTVGADGNIVYNTEHQDGPQTGYLVFVIADCTFEGLVCEAGDMAIYDGVKWNVVSGENQIAIVGNNGEAKTTVKVGPAAEILTVEGKTLELVLDYADLNNNHINKAKGEIVDVIFAEGDMVVDKAYVKLSKADDSKKTIGKVETIKKASKLTDGTVEFSGISELVTDVTWGTFDPGKLNEIVLNEDARTFAVTGGSVVKNSNEDFVSEVTLGNVTFDASSQGAEGAFALVGGIQEGEGQSFVTGVKDAEGNVKTEFTVAGCYQPNVEKFVTGLVGGITDVVTSFDAGSLTFDSNGSTFVTGFSDGSTDVISSIEVSANNDTSVLSTATVNNHVLSFTPVNVASGVSVSTNTKTLVKGGYTYVAPSAGKTSLTTDGFTKSSDVKYTFNTNKETTYTTTSAYYKLTTPQLGITKGGYELSNTGMVANVSAKTFAVNVSGGVLPSLSDSEVVKQANVTGSVGTGLDYVDVNINVVDAAAMEITLPGAYSLVAGSEGDGVEVGKAGNLAINNATVNLSEYLKDFAIVETKTQA